MHRRARLRLGGSLAHHALTVWIAHDAGERDPLASAVLNRVGVGFHSTLPGTNRRRRAELPSHRDHRADDSSEGERHPYTIHGDPSLDHRCRLGGSKIGGWIHEQLHVGRDEVHGRESERGEHRERGGEREPIAATGIVPADDRAGRECEKTRWSEGQEKVARIHPMHYRAPGLQPVRCQPRRDENNLLVNVRSENERCTERPDREEHHAKEFAIHSLAQMRYAYRQNFTRCKVYTYWRHVKPDDFIANGDEARSDTTAHPR